MSRWLDTKTGKILEFGDPDTRAIATDATLLRMVRDRLATMTDAERLEFMHRLVQGYCLECGAVDQPPKLCPCLERDQ